MENLPTAGPLREIENNYQIRQNSTVFQFNKNDYTMKDAFKINPPILSKRIKPEDSNLDDILSEFSESNQLSFESQSPNQKRKVSPAVHWTKEEDILLTQAVQANDGKNWKKIAESIPGKADVQCLHRWQKVLNPTLVKGPWTEEEDNLVLKLVEQHGPQKWTFIAEHLPGRIGKQCRER